MTGGLEGCPWCARERKSWASFPRPFALGPRPSASRRGPPPKPRAAVLLGDGWRAMRWAARYSAADAVGLFARGWREVRTLMLSVVLPSTVR